MFQPEKRQAAVRLALPQEPEAISRRIARGERTMQAFLLQVAVSCLGPSSSLVTGFAIGAEQPLGGLQAEE